MGGPIPAGVAAILLRGGAQLRQQPRASQAAAQKQPRCPHMKLPPGNRPGPGEHARTLHAALPPKQQAILATQVGKFRVPPQQVYQGGFPQGHAVQLQGEPVGVRACPAATRFHRCVKPGQAAPLGWPIAHVEDHPQQAQIALAGLIALAQGGVGVKQAQTQRGLRADRPRRQQQHTRPHRRDDRQQRPPAHSAPFRPCHGGLHRPEIGPGLSRL